MTAALLAGLLAATDSGSAQAAERLRTESIVLQAAEVHTGTGEVFKPGVVILLDGRVVAAGPAPPLPAGSRVIDCGAGILTPGLVDAACQLGTHALVGFSEQSSEVIPHLDTADSIDWFSESFERLAREGVTTVWVTGEAASVISARGAAVKTGGDVALRRLETRPGVKGTLGPETSRRGSFNNSPSRFRGVSFTARRPTTRMGASWVFRKAFFDALAFKESGATAADPAAMRALLDVLEGKVDLRMQLRTAMDFDLAARLCDEFGLRFSIESGIEAGKRLDLLKERSIPVIFGPVSLDGMSVSDFDGAIEALDTPRRLAEAGIPFCITAAEGIGERGLARQVGTAVRHGLARDRALRAVTADAAVMLGLEGRVGRIAPGLDADLVLWSGAPFDDSSRPVLVLIQGRPVFDPEERFGKENT
jgi:imidazolonepropionase-like amidohydrolase